MEKVLEEYVGEALIVIINTSFEYNSNNRSKELILCFLVEIETNDVHLQVEKMPINSMLRAIQITLMYLICAAVESEVIRCKAYWIDLREPVLRQRRLELHIFTCKLEGNRLIIDLLHILKTNF